MARVSMPKRVQSTSRDLNDAQDAIAATLRDVTRFDELDGATARGVTLSTTPVGIAHGLGRMPIGWRVIDKLDPGDVYRTAWTDRTVTLRTAAGSVRCDLYFW